MKKTRRIITLALALLMLLSLAAPAFAATLTNQTDHPYKAYQVFTGTQSDGSAELANIDWGTGVNAATLVPALKDLYPDLYVDGATPTAAQIAGKLTSVAGAKEFAEIVINHITTVSVDIAANQTTINVMPGYYLVVDQAKADGMVEDAVNPALLQVTNQGEFFITKKYSVPTPDKDILSIDAMGDHNHVKTEDYSIGDLVEFHLKAELPSNIGAYDVYKLVFHDALSEGLTFTEEMAGNLTVWMVDEVGTQTEITSYAVISFDDITCKATDGRDCSFHVTIENFKAVAGWHEGATVIVKYKALLNDNAAINTANPNHYQLEYSNNPNVDVDHDNDGTPDEDVPTGTLPWKDVDVYTTGITLKKVDGTTSAPLTGAKFRIEGTAMNRVKVDGAEFVAWTEGTKYWKLNDGSYTTIDPTTEGIDDSHYVNPTVVYERVVFADQMMMKDATNYSVEVWVNDNGILQLDGLAEGTYTITELVAPDGYNKLTDSIGLKITFDENAETYAYEWTGAIGEGSSATIANNKGTVLPETGGIGTTMFYIFGGIMFAGAAILLVTKKRMGTI